MESVALLLRDLVAQRTGIYVDDQHLDIFMEKLSSVILERGLSSPLDYYYLLKYDAGAELEWRRVIDAVSVRETFFWREFEAVRTLVGHVLPEYFSSNPSRPFRIWSAACASGEEPLTIAMAIREAGLWDRPIEILASDASPGAISAARAGIYRERSFRNLEPYLWKRYFTKKDSGWKIDPEIHGRINWFNANLLHEHEIGPLADSNVIFCRNVFIYFKAETISSILRTFARHMAPPALLFLGAAESLLRLTTQFELKEMGNAFVYARVTTEEKSWIA